MLRLLLAGIALAGSLAHTAALAQAWPAKPVKILVGASPGGGTDIIARLLADKMQAALGQPFVVENRPGAANTIASDVTAKSPPDGYTLLVGTNTAQAIAPHIMKLGFDPIRDLTPIALLVVVPNVVVVAPTVAATNIRDLVAEMKAKPAGFSCGSSGIGSTQHLACEAFALATGTKIVHVPYKGSAGALADLVGGQIQLDFDTTSSAMSFIKGGKVKALAVMTPRRSSELPDVPTLAEAGYPGVEMSTWYGLFGPAGLPREIQSRLHAEAMRALAMPDVKKKIEALAGETGTLSTAEFAAMAKSDYERSGKLVRDANIKPEQ
ncbi:MAG TPA: tripartite tricarboxylate transporter substrate binding protein [Usitatibacter sp.]|nr:tripartite tricarboxylate transporter substrate binding protein [Usitatibacter sp.]